MTGKTKKPMSAECRQKIKQALLGHTVTEHAKKQISSSHKNKIYINKTLNAALLVDFSCEIIVEKDVNATFVDVVKFGNITFESKINSNVEYLVFDSQNTNRCFNINGKLKYTEISLTSTNESLSISLLMILCDLLVLSY